MSYPDVERGLISYLGDLGTCYTSTPVDLQAHLPALRIQRVGGANDKFEVQDYPNVSIIGFAVKDPNNPRAAFDLIEAVRTRMDEMCGEYIAGVGLLEQSVNVSGPVDLFWPDQSVSATQATFRVTTKGT